MQRPNVDRSVETGEAPPPGPGNQRALSLSVESVASVAVAGFIATSAMSVVLVAAYGVAALFGSQDPNASFVLQWMWGLANNTLTERTQNLLPVALGVHFLSGIIWAFAYASFAEPRLKGPGWRRGALFSLAPGALSVVIFLPLVGGGMLGFGFDAGPLPVLGNFFVHLIYGVVLGQVYAPWGRRVLDGKGDSGNPEESRLVAQEERVVAIGMAVGLLAGALIAGLASAFDVVGYRFSTAALLGAVGGSLIGAFFASFLGFSQGDS